MPSADVPVQDYEVDEEYTKYAGYTLPSAAAGILRVSPTIRQDMNSIATACNAEEKCVAFTASGWLLSDVGTSSTWTADEDDELYVQKGLAENMADLPQSTQEVTGYTRHEKVSYKQHNIGRVKFPEYLDVEVIRDACDRNSRCVAFTTDGWLKGHLPEKQNLSEDTTVHLYTKIM